MIHTALARKYRPTRFSDLVAQEHVAAGLAGALAKNRVAHAYLLTGPRGVGKTSAARILAMALNCPQRGEGGADAGEPCGTCESCHRIWSGSANLDVVEIDAASNRGVDDARDLRERAMYAASAPGRFKVYIIDEAHMLTREAWNALLKTLEEPPPQVVFVFATTEPQKIANTAAPVMSRLQRFDFRRMDVHTIIQRLQYVAEQEGIEAEHDALLLMARVAHGGMRDALSLLDQAVAFEGGSVTAVQVRRALGLIDDEMYAELLDLVAERRSKDVFPFVARLVDGGADLAEFVGGAGEALRALLVRILGGQPDGVTETLRGAIERHAERYAEGDVLRMLKLLGEADWAIRRSPHARLHVETLLLQWTLLDRTVELQEVIEALKQGGTPSRRSTASGGQVGATAVSKPGSKPGSGAGRSGRGTGRSDSPAAEAPSRPLEGPLTLDALAERWPAVVQAAGRQRRLVREALSHATPAGVEGDEVTLEVSDCEVHLEGLERSREVVAKAIGEVTGKQAKVVYRPASGEAPPPPNNARRVSRGGDRDERLKGYRAKDAALDALADSLDLELLD
jgi:DNA polymerase-3 subunit gamma/tau